MKYYTLPRKLVWKMLRHENKEQGFTVEGAIISLLFDREDNKEKSQREYGRIWGRTRAWVRQNWDEIDAKTDLILAKSPQPTNNPKNREIYTESNNHNPATTHNYSITNNSNINTYSKPNTESVTQERAHEAKKTPSPDGLSDQVKLWQKVYPDEPLPQLFHQEELSAKCENLSSLEYTLKDWRAMGYNPLNITGIISRYKKQLDSNGTAPTTWRGAPGGATIHELKTGTGRAMPQGFQPGQGSAARRPKRPGEASEYEYLLQCGYTPEELAGLGKTPDASGHLPARRTSNGG